MHVTQSAMRVGSRYRVDSTWRADVLFWGKDNLDNIPEWYLCIRNRAGFNQSLTPLNNFGFIMNAYNARYHYSGHVVPTCILVSVPVLASNAPACHRHSAVR